MKFKTLINEFKNIGNSPTSLKIYAKSLIKYGIDKILSKSFKKALAKQIKAEAAYF